MTEDVEVEVFPYLENTTHLYLVVAVMCTAAVIAIAGESFTLI